MCLHHLQLLFILQSEGEPLSPPVFVEMMHVHDGVVVDVRPLKKMKEVLKRILVVKFNIGDSDETPKLKSYIDEYCTIATSALWAPGLRHLPASYGLVGSEYNNRLLTALDGEKLFILLFALERLLHSNALKVFPDEEWFISMCIMTFTFYSFSHLGPSVAEHPSSWRTAPTVPSRRSCFRREDRGSSPNSRYP